MSKRFGAASLPTTGELKLLESLWRLGEGTIEDVLEALGDPPPNYKTVQTVLRIMENKRMVTHRSRGRAFVYSPLVRRDQVTRLSIRSLLARYFGGSRTELLLNMLDDEGIDVAELKELEDLIRRYRKARGSPDEPRDPNRRVA